MRRPAFEVQDIGSGCYLIHDGGRTVAIVTGQGYIDWLVRTVDEEGPRLAGIKKATHLSYTLGLKLLLVTPTPETQLRDLAYRVEEGGSRLVLTGKGQTAAGDFASVTAAALTADAKTGRYEWSLQTQITCTAAEPVEVPGLEYNNVYPSKAGRCMMFAPHKEYDRTLVTDRDGTVWEFPHQHSLHYGRKMEALRFDVGTMAGFFGELANPVVIVDAGDAEPFWGICDMYYDLHCQARPTRPLAPGESLNFRYRVKYLDAEESAAWTQKARRVPVTKEDYARCDCPRLDLGRNTFDHPVLIDRPDDASIFWTKPPVLVWDRAVGHKTRGALRITNDASRATVWTAQPASTVSANQRLAVRALAKTRGVEGKGFFVRVQQFAFVWEPAPHVEFSPPLESEPLVGTTDDWVEIAVPELAIPPDHLDGLVHVEVVLDGKGVGWLTQMDVDLEGAADEPLSPTDVPDNKWQPVGS